MSSKKGDNMRLFRNSRKDERVHRTRLGEQFTPSETYYSLENRVVIGMILLGVTFLFVVGAILYQGFTQGFSSLLP